VSADDLPAEFRDAKKLARRNFSSPLTRWQNVLAIVDFPVPARPASQKTEMDEDEDEDGGSATQESIAERTSLRVSSRQPSGESRELYCADDTGLSLSSFSSR
jgi:hypothetical protein